MRGVNADNVNLPTVDVDVLICGTGPAGASLACFLAYNGIKGLLIGQTSSTANTPRAHYTNVAALECLRDIGLESECRKVATPIQASMYQRICTTMAGKELARAFSFGNDPRRIGEYNDASPCEPADLPQTRLEPILVKYAAQNGFTVRFDTRLLSFVQDTETGIVESVIEDLVMKNKTLIRSRYLCGADGANSAIVRELQLPLQDNGVQGLALNVLIEADMSKLMAHSPGSLHLLTRPDKPQPIFGLIGIARPVVTWTEWVIVLLAHPSVTEITATKEEIMSRVKELIGDDSIGLKLKRISTWKINECYAEKYSQGNVFCLGDAVHRHPPHNGLGSNTCIQDAYNLAWKLAYVLTGRADASLLSTYSEERQPIGKYIVTRANDSVRLYFSLFSVLGVLEPDIERRKQVLAELKADSPEGAERRKAFREAFTELEQERSALGGEMNQLYQSQAVYLDDEKIPPPLSATYRDATLYHIQNTYPGFRLPHASLGVPVEFGPRLPAISTQDLAGKGKFTILTGVAGKKTWSLAAASVSSSLQIDITVYGIGWGQDYEDIFFNWFERRGVEEKGAVLVRPDRTVAWRSFTALPEKESCDKLAKVMRKVLGLSQPV